MVENPYLLIRTEQQRMPPVVTAVVALPPLWPSLKPQSQKQLAQLWAELIRRSQRQPLKWEDNPHER